MIPQMILLLLMALSLGITLAKDGEPDQHSFLSSAIAAAISLALLYWGGFFNCFFGG